MLPTHLRNRGMFHRQTDSATASKQHWLLLQAEEGKKETVHRVSCLPITAAFEQRAGDQQASVLYCVIAWSLRSLPTLILWEKINKVIKGPYLNSLSQEYTLYTLPSLPKELLLSHRCAYMHTKQLSTGSKWNFLSVPHHWNKDWSTFVNIPAWWVQGNSPLIQTERSTGVAPSFKAYKWTMNARD